MLRSALQNKAKATDAGKHKVVLKDPFLHLLLTTLISSHFGLRVGLVVPPVMTKVDDITRQAPLTCITPPGNLSEALSHASLDWKSNNAV